MSGRMIPMAGKTFGALRAVEPCRNMRAGWTWLCWCLTCGAIQDRLGSQLRSGYRDTCAACGAEGYPPLKAERAAEPSQADLAEARDRLRSNGSHLGAVSASPVRNARGRARKLAKAKRLEARAAECMREAKALRAEVERHAGE